MTNRSIGRPYKQFHDSGRFDVIVVGSGIGGMGTAALLAKAAGQRVLVLEKHYTAGGFTHVFRRPGFEWDVGVHYVGQVHTPGSPANALFEYLAEGRLSWNAMPEVYDRVNIDGLRFDYVSGREHLRDALVETFPRERSGNACGVFLSTSLRRLCPRSSAESSGLGCARRFSDSPGKRPGRCSTSSARVES
jgi:all-trans-retinol 13,14-reductase